MEAVSGYKQTDVGAIPNDWDVGQLGGLQPFVTSGSRGWASFYAEHGDLFVRITNLSRESIYLDLADSKFVKLPPYANEGMRTQLHEHDVLISITADIGIVGYVDKRVPTPAYINQHIALVRIAPSKANGKFISYFLASERPQKLFRTSTDTGAKAGMSLGTVLKIQTALPPLSEQRSIAVALSDVDALLDALDRLIAKKRDLKQAAMQQLLTGQSRLPGFHGAWVTKTFGDVITHCSSGATPRRNRPDYYKGSIRWITSGELNYNAIFDTAEKISSEAVVRTNLTIVPKGTFLMAITGLEAEGTRGSCAIVGAPSTTNQSCMAIYPTDALATEYLFHYYVLRGKALALQYCQGTKQQSYTAKLVKNLPLDLPPTVTEQKAIADVLSDMDSEIVALKQRRDKTLALKQGMMQELLTGRTRLV